MWSQHPEIAQRWADEEKKKKHHRKKRVVPRPDKNGYY